MAGQAEVTKNMVTELLAGKHPSHLAVLMKTLSDPKVIDALVAAGQAHRVEIIVAKVMADKEPSNMALLMKALSDPKAIEALVAAGQAHVVTSVITAKGSLPLPFAATA